jgi:hypothetical protein
MGESMETHQIFRKSFFSIFSPPKCRYALGNTFDEKKNGVLPIEIPSFGAVLGNSYDIL